jgi:hypothetical protein
MNTTLPTPRDLPPHRRAQIRAELERTVAGRRSRRGWLVPLATAAVVLVAVVATVWLSPWNRDGGGGTATQPTGTEGAPEIPNLSPAEHVQIVQGCLASTGISGLATTEQAHLYNLVDVDGVRTGLIYGERLVMDCRIDGPAMPYDSGGLGEEDIGFDFTADRNWLPGPVTMDVVSGSAGGDTAGSRPEYAGEPGIRVVGGRITADVAKVTYTVGDRTVEAALANGTYLARILYPSTWDNSGQDGIVRAYDAAGQLLGAVNDPDHPGPFCSITPNDQVISGPVAAAERCEPAIPWR